MKRLGLIVLVISLIAAFFITSAIITSWSTPTPSASQPSVPPTSMAVHGSVFGGIFAFAIVIIILIIIAWWVYHEHDGKWDEIIKNNATMTFLGLIVLNAIAYILHYEGWRSFYDTGRLFWMTNIGIILFVYLIFEKSKAAKVVAAILALIIITALFRKTATLNDSANISKNQTFGLSDVSMEVALPIIAECESGGRQFEEDGKTPYKNRGIPEKGIEPSTAFGKYQFLESHREPAKKLGFDLNTEEGQDGYARYRYSQTGTKDWEFDEQYGGGRACWGPKLASLKFRQGAYDLTVSTPIGSPSGEIPVPLGYEVRWGESEDSFLIMNDLGRSASYNRSDGIFENLPPPSKRLRFKSLDDKKAAVVRLRFQKMNP